MLCSSPQLAHQQDCLSSSNSTDLSFHALTLSACCQEGYRAVITCAISLQNVLHQNENDKISRENCVNGKNENTVGQQV